MSLVVARARAEYTPQSQLSYSELDVTRLTAKLNSNRHRCSRDINYIVLRYGSILRDQRSLFTYSLNLRRQTNRSPAGDNFMNFMFINS
jgi:hypothetical protein